MKILIDTQVFVWLIEDDSRLGKEAKQLLFDAQNEVMISYFSFYEMTIKASIGKLLYDSSIVDDLPEMGVDLIMPSIEALSGYEILNQDNKDPFDNMIIAVARTEKATLITSNPK